MQPAATEGTGPDSDVESMRKLLHAESTRALSSPLSLLAAIAQSKSQTPDSEVVSEWVKQRQEATVQTPASDVLQNGWVQTEARKPTTVAADLRHGLPRNWRAFGAAFSGTGPDGLPQDAAADSWSSLTLLPTSGQSVSSAALSPNLRGQLHSPEFVLTHPEILIQAAGKGARVRLCIDGYVMNEYSELLFGGCRQPIDTDGEFRWIRLAGDVQRYIGHRCHLEFLDEGEGWFAVREVRLMGQPGETPVTHQEICYTSAALQIAPAASREQLVHEVVRTLAADPAWPAMMAQAGLLSPEQQTSYQQSMESWRKTAEQVQPGEPVLVMCEGPGEDEYVFIRGNHNNKGPTASRHMLTALDRAEPLQNTSGSGRLELAERVLADTNPFPSRVIVNRVWQHLFGRGIVPTSDNFGVLGESPTHPELLDFLAAEFTNDGWSIKRLIRRLLMTHAYRLSSHRDPLAEQADPENKLLHHFSVRRLEGEALRDAIIAISGRLDSTMYGPPVPVYLSSFMQGRGRPGQSGPLDGAGRRSIYQAVNRNFLNPFMLVFDTPQPATAIGRRSMSNVPAQALMLMNNEFVHEQARVWAAHLIKDVSSQNNDIVQHAFRQAFSRVPTPEEHQAFAEFSASLAAERNITADVAMRDLEIVSEVCHVLLNQKEFLFLD